MLGVGVASFLAQLWLNRGMQLAPVAKASAANYAQVPYSFVLGAALFGEPITLIGVLGSCMVAAGVVAVALDKQAAAAAGHAPGAALKARDSFKQAPDALELGLVRPGGSGGSGSGGNGIPALFPMRPLSAEPHHRQAGGSG